jgi:hypothetical protein
VASTASDVTIKSVAFDMVFTDMDKFDRPDAIGAAGTNVTVRDVEFINIGYGVNANNKPKGLLVQDSFTTSDKSVRSYFVWAQGSDQVFVGNTVLNSTREHNIRVVGVDRVLIAHNDLTNSTNQVSGDSTPKGTLTIHKGSYVYISANKLNDGPATIGPLGDGDGLKSPGDRWNWAIVENNEFNTRMNVDHGAAHIMIRNNVFQDTSRSPIEVEGWSDIYDRGTSDVRVYDNVAKSSGRTFVKLMGGAVEGLVQVSNDFVSSTTGLSLWSDAGISTPTQWQEVSSMLKAA